jgi:hypothetical protein
VPHLLLLASLSASILFGQATVTVPGTANPYLAGMPPGTKAPDGDIAPRESPVFAGRIPTGAATVTFSVAGSVAHGPSWPTEPPEGSHEMAFHSSSKHGIGGLIAPFEALLGVFLGDQRPDRSRPPKRLTYTKKLRETAEFSPLLKQVFFIGSGTTASGAMRRFLIPPGATRLYLGTMDEYGWYNNIGEFTVQVMFENASSNLFSVDSSVSFQKWACLPDRARCTPGQPIVESRAAGVYHVLLPAHLEWAVSIPTADGKTAAIGAVTGVVCLDAAAERCSGPDGKGPAGEGYLSPRDAMGKLISKNGDGRTWFSVNGRGESFKGYSGFFEFDVSIQ